MEHAHTTIRLELCNAGLPLMLALVDEVEFASAGHGTRVRMRKHLPGSSRDERVCF